MKGSKRSTSNFSFLAKKNMKAAFPLGLQRMEAAQCQQLNSLSTNQQLCSMVFPGTRAYKPPEKRGHVWKITEQLSRHSRSYSTACPTSTDSSPELKRKGGGILPLSDSFTQVIPPKPAYIHLRKATFNIKAYSLVFQHMSINFITLNT